jgi:hypothetical protein
MPGYRYKLHDAEGGDVGEVEIAVLLRPGDEFHWKHDKLRVLEVVAVMETDSRYVGFLMVEPALDA